MRFNKALIQYTIAILVIALGLPFILHFANELATLSLFCGQLCLAFLFCLFAFPKANYKEVLRLSSIYLMYLGICFTILSFAPVPSKFKIFSYTNLLVQCSVTINLAAVVFLNVAALIFVTFFTKTKYKDMEVQTKESNKVITKRVLKSKEPIQESIENPQELATEFISPELQKLEQAISRNINPHIKEVLCFDEQGNSLPSSTLKWTGPSSKQVLQEFYEQDQLVQNLNSSKLCRSLINFGGSWYMIAKHKNIFLCLESRGDDLNPLMDLAFKTFREL